MVAVEVSVFGLRDMVKGWRGRGEAVERRTWLALWLVGPWWIREVKWCEAGRWRVDGKGIG